MVHFSLIVASAVLLIICYSLGENYSAVVVFLSAGIDSIHPSSLQHLKLQQLGWEVYTLHSPSIWPLYLAYP